MAETKAKLGTWPHPALVLFSTEDPVFPVRVGERWAERLPGAEPLELIEGAGHFLQEDQGQLVAERIVLFLRRTD
jgi:haloalkane dehalogenase